MKYKEIKSNPNLSIDEISFIMLTRSCESVRNRCNEKREKYKDVRCDLTPIPLRNALLGQTAFWAEWVRLTKEWVYKGYKDRDRPTLDRIDEKGHYDIGNIQALPKWLNTTKATAKKCLIINFNENWQIEVQLIWGQEKTLKLLELSKKELTEEYRNQLEKIDLLFFNFVPEADIVGLSLLEFVNY
jgi:hypothetical protein